MILLFLVFMLAVTQAPGISDCQPTGPDEQTERAIMADVKSGKIPTARYIGVKCKVWE